MTYQFVFQPDSLCSYVAPNNLERVNYYSKDYGSFIEVSKVIIKVSKFINNTQYNRCNNNQPPRNYTNFTLNLKQDTINYCFVSNPIANVQESRESTNYNYLLSCILRNQ